MARLDKINWVKFIDTSIETTLLVLFFLVPLVVVPTTQELFEFNKMYLVYFLALILLGLEIIKILLTPKPVIKSSRLLLPALIFIGTMTLTTIFSIDRHESFFGYYGRFHGGLWSWLSYGVIFYSLTQRPNKIYLSIIKISLISGALVGLWGLLEHYGIDASYWVQDVKSRVFSTLGQPNWLAAYLGMLLPWSVIFFLEAKRKIYVLALLALNLVLYTCFIFTYSRGGNYGLAAGAISLILLLGLTQIKRNWRRLVVLMMSAGLVTVVFASPLSGTLFKEPPHRTTGTLEGGDETGNIRLIVWKGAWEIFQHHPLLGTGLETFGDSFYQFRPVEMNKTSEWDFLFNRAHNEYLNFLATTGVFGTGGYLILIGSFLWWGIRFILKRTWSEQAVWVSAAVSSTVVYLVQNIFSFTVVPLALLLVLNLSSLAQSDSHLLSFNLPRWLRRKSYLGITLTLVTLLAGLFTIVNLWRADLFYAAGTADNELGNPDSAEKNLLQAARLNPTEPNYLMQLAFAEANLASAYRSSETSSALIKISRTAAQTALSISPHSLSLWRLQAQISGQLAALDGSYQAMEQTSRQTAAHLAPTEPRVRLELAQYYFDHGQFQTALSTGLEALQLKPDLGETLQLLVKTYLQLGNKDSAKLYLTQALKLDPTNPELISLSQKVGL